MSRYVYFIGIGGIGMSALARYFNRTGSEVAGYDRTETLLTRQLVQEGIEVIYEDHFGLVPDGFKTAEALLIYTPAVPEDLALLHGFRELGLTSINVLRYLVCSLRENIRLPWPELMGKPPLPAWLLIY